MLSVSKSRSQSDALHSSRQKKETKSQINLSNFGQLRNVLQTNQNFGKLVSAVFRFRVSNANTTPSKITGNFAKILDDGMHVKIAKLRELLPPLYIHALLYINVTEFELTRSSMKLNTELLGHALYKVERKERLSASNKYI